MGVEIITDEANQEVFVSCYVCMMYQILCSFIDCNPILLKFVRMSRLKWISFAEQHVLFNRANSFNVNELAAPVYTSFWQPSLVSSAVIFPSFATIAVV